MADEQDQVQQPEDGSEEAFFARFQTMLDGAFSDQRMADALDAWAGRLSADLDAEEERAGKAKPVKEENQGGEAERVEAGDEPTRAERGRASGGVGPGSRSRYWDHARRFLYGNRDR